MYGTGSIFKRGRIWYYSFHENGRNKLVSSKSERKSDAIRLREQHLKAKMAGVQSPLDPSKILCGELLDDVLAHVQAKGKASTAKIWGLVIEANLRPFFGHLKAATMTTVKLREYREERKTVGKVSDATCNRELSILRTAFRLGLKCTPPKVVAVPYFPMTSEQGNARQGFLTDDQYAKLRDALPDYLKPLFVVAYFTGIRKGELLQIRWSQVDFERGFITLRTNETKASEARAVPILAGDMERFLRDAFQHASAGNRDGSGGGNLHHAPVFTNDGSAIRDFRGSWTAATKAAEVPDLHFHDLRRSAVMRMRRAGVPQVVRMKITGHKTDSMDRRYGIVDTEDIAIAKELLEKFGKSKGSSE